MPKRRREDISHSTFVSWNVDGLRALLRSAGVHALEKLLKARPIALCLLEHKLQESSLDAREDLESHLGDAFVGGRPDHVPVESEVSGLFGAG